MSIVRPCVRSVVRSAVIGEAGAGPMAICTVPPSASYGYSGTNGVLTAVATPGQWKDYVTLEVGWQVDGNWIGNTNPNGPVTDLRPGNIVKWVEVGMGTDTTQVYRETSSFTVTPLIYPEGFQLWINANDETTMTNWSGNPANPGQRIQTIRNAINGNNAAVAADATEANTPVWDFDNGRLLFGSTSQMEFVNALTDLEYGYSIFTKVTYNSPELQTLWTFGLTGVDGVELIVDDNVEKSRIKHPPAGGFNGGGVLGAFTAIELYSMDPVWNITGFRNGVQVATGTVDQPLPSSIPGFLGSLGGGNYLQGSIHQLLVWNPQLNSTLEGYVNDWLATQP